MSSNFNRSCLSPVLAIKIDACQSSAVPERSGSIRHFHFCAVDPYYSLAYVFRISRVMHLFNGFLVSTLCVVDTWFCDLVFLLKNHILTICMMKPLLSQSILSTELSQSSDPKLNVDSIFGTQRNKEYCIDDAINFVSRWIVVLLRYWYCETNCS